MDGHAEGAPAPPGAMRFSTDWFPETDRLGIWREEFGRKVIRLDMAPLGDGPLRYDARFAKLGEVMVGRGTISAIRCERTKAMMQDGRDDIVLLLGENVPIEVAQGRVEATLAPGACLVRRSDEAGRTQSEAGRFLTLTLPLGSMAERVSDIDRLGFAVLPGQMAELRMLTGYAAMVLGECARGGAMGAATQARLCAHILDLAALAVGARRDAWAEAQGRGVRAARRLEVRAAIRREARDPEFRIAALADRMRVSPSYIRKLLAEEGESFSRLVLAARLDHARRWLSDPARAAMGISAIAFASGFGDVSYFNRAFRRAFDMTPGAARKAAMNPVGQGETIG